MTNRAQELAVKIGKEFLLEFASNRTTGYQWKAEYDSTILQLTAVNYQHTSNKPGAGGTESFTFKPLRTGKTVIRMLYGRPWEQKTIQESTYNLNIHSESATKSPVN
ncbi:MAG: protease inhibitor I42 family protein [Candidatus Bathyarchaeia archaeon]